MHKLELNVKKKKGRLKNKKKRKERVKFPYCEHELTLEEVWFPFPVFSCKLRYGFTNVDLVEKEKSLRKEKMNKEEKYKNRRTARW